MQRAPIPARLEFLGFDIWTGDDQIASDPAHGEGGHRRPLPQSSSASRFTAGAAGFLDLSQCRVRLRHLHGAVALPVTRAEIGDDFGEGGRKHGARCLGAGH